MRVLDTFAGIGGFSLAFEALGMETVAFCEIDKHACKVLEHNWPGIPIYNDIAELTNERLRADGLTGIDIVCGGFPCQDISGAGKQTGIHGERSGLWSELCRLIGEVRPGLAVLENVTNLTSGDSGRWFGRVLGDLAEIGYSCIWNCIPASQLGANHHRDRIWIIAYPNCAGLRIEQITYTWGSGEAEPAVDGAQGHVANTDDRPGGANPGPKEKAEGISGKHRKAGRSRMSGRTGSGEDDVANTTGTGRWTRLREDRKMQPAKREGINFDDDSRIEGAGDVPDTTRPGRPACSSNGMGDDDEPRRGEGQSTSSSKQAELSYAYGARLQGRLQHEIAYQEGWEVAQIGRASERCLGRQRGRDCYWGVEPQLGRVADGVPNRTHRLKQLGNAIVPQLAELLGRAIIEHLSGDEI